MVTGVSVSIAGSKVLTLPIVSNYHMVTSPFIKATLAHAQKASLVDTATTTSVAPNLAMRTGKVTPTLRCICTYGNVDFSEVLASALEKKCSDKFLLLYVEFVLLGPTSWISGLV